MVHHIFNTSEYHHTMSHLHIQRRLCFAIFILTCSISLHFFHWLSYTNKKMYRQKLTWKEFSNTCFIASVCGPYFPMGIYIISGICVRIVNLVWYYQQTNFCHNFAKSLSELSFAIVTMRPFSSSGTSGYSNYIKFVEVVTDLTWHMLKVVTSGRMVWSKCVQVDRYIQRNLFVIPQQVLYIDVSTSSTHLITISTRSPFWYIVRLLKQ